MNINTAVAFVLNNLFLVVAGGLVAAWLAWRMWQKVEATMARMGSWNDLVFWAVKLFVVTGILFTVGGMIYSRINSAVVAAVNSPSVQTSGQALVQLGAAADHLVGWDGSSSVGGDMVQNTNMDIGGAISLLEPVIAAAPESAPVEEVLPTTLEMKPLSQMFEAAQANIATSQPTNSPVGEYIVQGGDSLSKIAAKLGVDVRALCKANNLPDCNLLRRGQRLIVPAAGLPALEADLNQRVAAVINAPRVTAHTIGYTPRQNQSYAPAAWKTIEEGEMSIGEPANMSANDNQVFASFPTN